MMELTNTAKANVNDGSRESMQAFMDECAKKGIALTNSDKRAISKYFRDLYADAEKKGTKVKSTKFDAVAKDLTANIKSIEEYVFKNQQDDFALLLDNEEDDNEEKREPAISEAEEEDAVTAPATVAEKEAVEVRKEEPVKAPEKKRSSKEEKPAQSVQKTTAPITGIERLDMVIGMKKNRSRSKEITKEINRLRQVRNVATRSYSMTTDDIAIVKGIMSYAETLDSTDPQRQFNGSDLAYWNGVIHAAMSLLVKELNDREGSKDMINSIVASVEKNELAKAQIDEKIYKLMQERDTV